MKYLRLFSKFLEDLVGVNQEYIFLVILSVISYVIIKLILVCLKKALKTVDQKKGYTIYQKCRLALTILK